ncbi:MAG: lipoic acid synthetase [Chloroflexi bacterium]|nr:MAG: lipoic acid synthetase [Chloroflexota bacterium]
MTTETNSKGYRLPPWFKVKAPGGKNYVELRNLLRDSELHTVCEEAKCPNIGDCWDRRAATFMILGDICTRACRYCAVTSGKPLGLDLGEPDRLARTVERLGLKYVVITSVNRDDLPDRGAFVLLNVS